MDAAEICCPVSARLCRSIILANRRLLFAKALPKKRDAASIKRLAALGGKTDVRKPLFVGVDSSTIRKRFNIYAAIQTAVDRMGGLFEDALAQEK
jgi:hypothetical protein